MEDKHRITILKALQGGINAARTHKSVLIFELGQAEFLTASEADLETQIEACGEWIKELADALQWLNGKQYKEMQALYPEVKIDDDRHI